MNELAAIILAAGKGTRMKSVIPKVLHQIAGAPMLYFPIKTLHETKVERILVVVGHHGELIKDVFGSWGLDFVVQARQLGTGHAVMTAMKKLKGFAGDVLILSGDVPLITKETLKGLVKLHGRGKIKPAISLITAHVKNPAGYGRIIRSAGNAPGDIERIVEEKDSTPLQKNINEINTGIYLVSSAFLNANMKRLKSNNAQGEYYLPDLISLAVGQGKKVSAMIAADADEVMGVNNRVELAAANKIMKLRKNSELMLSGVTIMDPDTTYVDYNVTVGAESIIYPNVHLWSGTEIGANCVIEEGVRIENSVIGENSTIKSHTIIESSVTGEDVFVGPFARIRPGTIISDSAHIGNFVEVKNSIIGKKTKANHLSYLGDAVIGDGVNVGAGTITCNYDGIKKHTTIIEDGAFIGSNSELVAPVKVGRNAYVGSGTTVTDDVPEDSLVVTRAPARVIMGWAKKRRRKKG